MVVGVAKERGVGDHQRRKAVVPERAVIAQARLGHVAAIAVKEDDDFAISRERAQPCAKRPSISALRLCYHASAGGGCNFRCAIGAAVIDDDYFVGNIARH